MFLFRDCNVSRMQLTLRSNLAKRTLLLSEVLGMAALALWISKNYVAEVIARQPAVKHLQLAIRLDPGASEYHLRLARILEYSPADIDPNSAVGHLRRAVELMAVAPGQGHLTLIFINITASF
jgi:hypothetical protein